MTLSILNHTLTESKDVTNNWICIRWSLNLSPTESVFLDWEVKQEFRKHDSLEGVEIRDLDIQRVPIDIQRRIQDILDGGEITHFTAIKIDTEVPMHQHTTDSEIYFGGNDGSVVLLDWSQARIGKFDLGDDIFTIARIGYSHGVRSKNGTTFFGVKFK